MTEAHLQAIIGAAEGKKQKDGWFALPEGRHVTLYAAAGGTTLTVARVEALLVAGELVHARTVKGEVFVLALVDLFAGQVEAAAQGARRAGFG